MALPEVYGLTDVIQTITSAYGAQAVLPADVSKGSQFGPSFNAVALAMLLLQNENVYVDSISRLGSIPDPLPNGSPNPDVDSFVNAFGFYRLGPSPASGYVTATLPSPAGSSGYVIPVGAIFSPPAGPQFVVTGGGTGFNASANGYVISPGLTTVNAYVVCSTIGAAGNVAANTITTVIVGLGQQPAGYTVTNASAFTNGVVSEVGAPLKNRFALYISGGGEGTPNSILAAAYAVQTGLNLSYGDQVEGVKSGSTWTFTPSTIGWFTLIVAQQSGGIWVPGSSNLVNSTGAIAQAILNTVRPAGISFAVAPPTTVTVSGQGTVFVSPGFDPTLTVSLVTSAFTNFVGSIGLNQTGGSTICSLMQTYVALAAVPGVAYIDGLLLNGGTADISANFGQLLTPGSASFVAS